VLSQNPRVQPNFENSPFLEVNNNSILIYSQNSFKLIDIETGQTIDHYFKNPARGDGTIVRHLYNSDGLIIVLVENGQVTPHQYFGEVLDVQTLKKIAEFPIDLDSNQVKIDQIKISISSDRKFIAVAYSDGTIALREFKSGNLISHVGLPSDAALSKVFFSSQSNYLFASQLNSEVRFFELP
jgi:WD40 repeat protein